MKKSPPATTHLRAFTLIEIMVVVVIIGLLAALAVPGYMRVRQSSQDSAVRNNLRQLLYAADQYFLEKGVTEVGTDQLVGVDKYVKIIENVANEVYPTEVISGQSLVATNVGGERTVSVR